MEITVAEDLAQEALFRYDITADDPTDGSISLNVCDFISSEPRPCIGELKSNTQTQKPSLQAQLSQIISEIKAEQNGCKCCENDSICLLSQTRSDRQTNEIET